jgi:hypothetical protein
MKTLKMTVEFTYDDSIWHGDSEEDKDWFFDSILFGPDLQLGEFGDVGDMLGDIKVTGIT